MSDTIYALATPPGKSGVAVLRISGSKALAIAEAMSGGVLEPRRAHLRQIRDANGELLDSGLVIYFSAPHSFTGEDVVELQIHGSRAAVLAVSAELENQGAVLAEAGAFTRRALENNKLDILQVEALADFIASDTELQRKQSVVGIGGRNSQWAADLREKIVKAMSLVALAIDFVDEELPEDLLGQIEIELGLVQEALVHELQRSKKARSLRDGFRVAILGKPNVGKSTLLNAIAGREVAIATDMPGTTRDAIELYIDLHGLPVIFIDTAGLRETDDVVERFGVEKAQSIARGADLRIVLYEESSEVNEFEIFVKPYDLIVQSKGDVFGKGQLAVSAKSGEGIDALLELVVERLAVDDRELGRFSHDRQIKALGDALIANEKAAASLRFGEAQLDLVAEYLRQAVFSMDRLIGRVDVEDMLDVIFSEFCIGK